MEDNRPDDIDKLFKDSLQPLRRKPAKTVWENIESELDKDNRRLLIVQLRLALLVAAGLFILVGGTELYFHPAAKNPIARNPRVRPGALKTTVPGSAGISRDSALRNSSDRANLVTRIVEQSLAAKPGEPAESPLYSRSGFAASHVRFSDNKKPLLARGSPVVTPLQLIGPRTQISLFVPNYRIQLPRLTAPKQTISLLAPQRPRRWAITGVYRSEFAGYNITDKDSMAVNGNEIDKKEKNVLSSDVMLLLNYKLSKHWVIETGLGYSWAKSHASPTTSYAVSNNGEVKFQVNTLSGYGYVPASASTPPQVGDSVLVQHSTTTLHYVNIPFMLSYALQLKRLTLMPGVGISLNSLTGATLETKLRSAYYSQQDYVVRMYGLKRLNYGVLIKAQLAYAIDPHWSIDMVASFKNALSPINLRTVVATYPYNMGVGAGITYNF